MRAAATGRTLRACQRVVERVRLCHVARHDLQPCAGVACDSSSSGGPASCVAAAACMRSALPPRRRTCCCLQGVAMRRWVAHHGPHRQLCGLQQAAHALQAGGAAGAQHNVDRWSHGVRVSGECCGGMLVLPSAWAVQEQECKRTARRTVMTAQLQAPGCWHAADAQTDQLQHCTFRRGSSSSQDRDFDEKKAQHEAAAAQDAASDSPAGAQVDHRA